MTDIVDFERMRAEIERLRTEVKSLKRDADRHRHARLCAHVDQHGAWHIFPGDSHDVEEAAQRYDADLDSAISEAALQSLADMEDELGLNY